MTLLDRLVKKHGETEGRKRYNRWHQLYRKRNKERFLKYWVEYRKRQKVNKDAASSRL